MTQFCGPPCAGGHAHLGWSIGRGKRTNISRPKTSNPRSGDRLSSHRGHREEARRRRPRKGSKARRERSKLGTLPRQAAKRPGLDSPPRQGDVEKGGFSWAIPDRNFATVFFRTPALWREIGPPPCISYVRCSSPPCSLIASVVLATCPLVPAPVSSRRSIRPFF